MANKLVLLDVFSGSDFLFTYPDGHEVYYIDIVFVCKDFTGEILFNESEVTDIKWFDIKKLPSKISPSIIKILDRFQCKILIDN